MKFHPTHSGNESLSHCLNVIENRVTRKIRKEIGFIESRRTEKI